MLEDILTMNQVMELLEQDILYVLPLDLNPQQLAYRENHMIYIYRLNMEINPPQYELYTKYRSDMPHEF